METKLGIIIPTYNSLATLKTLVNNIFDYTDGDYQVYIIEDGQKKETIKWLKKQPVKAILNKKNLGVAGSWNKGLREAEKEGCTHFAILNDDIEISGKWWDAGYFEKNIHLVCLDEPCPIPITGWFFIIDKWCIDNIGYFDEQFSPYYYEDYDYFIRLIYAGANFKKIKLPVKHIGGKTIGVNNKVMKENWLKFRNKYPKIRLQI